jgi:tetratricopeptide (TPR) repeat protein
MVQRNLKEISHGTLTDHRITAVEGEPYPEIAFRQTTAELPDLVRLTAIPKGQSDALPLLTLLEAYQQLASTDPEAYQGRQVAVLNQLAKTESNNPFVLSALAQNVLRQRSPSSETEAMRYLARAVEFGSTNPTDYLRLGDLLARFGRTSDSVQILQRGIRLAPYNGLLYRSLALRQIAMGRYSLAAEAAKQAFQLMPEDATTRMLLKTLEEAPTAAHDDGP